MSQSYASAGIPLDPVWKDWTPTYSGITVGNGTVEARFVESGKLVVARFILILGSTSTVGSTGAVSLPVTAASFDVQNAAGLARFIDNSPFTTYLGSTRIETTTSMRPLPYLVDSASSAPLKEQGLDSTTPFTWAVDDFLVMQVTYEAA